MNKAKVCIQCGKLKLLACFWPNKNREDGLHPICEDCALENARGRGSHKLCTGCYELRPRRAFRRDKTALDGLHRFCKICQRDMQRSWNVKKPHKQREYTERRDALIREAGGKVPEEIRQGLFDRYGRKCLCCGRPEGAVTLSIDHIIPRSHGGTNDPENLQVLCTGCNSFKRDKEHDYRPEAFRESA